MSLRTRRWLGGAFGIALSLLASLGLAGCGGTGSVASDKPRVLRFVASAPSVASGAVVTLQWNIEGADLVSITASPGGTILEPSSNLNGSLLTPPIAASTSYMLHATGPGGSADASVIVSLELEIVAFAADPATIRTGASTTLRWETSNATRVRIDVEGGSLVPGVEGLSGEVSVSPRATTRYVLTADGGGVTKSRTAEVTVSTPPEVRRFSATPSTIVPGGTSILEHDVRGADTILIRDPMGREIYNGTEASHMSNVMPAATERYTLVATNGSGTTTATTTVVVGRGDGASVNFFTARPLIVGTGGSSVLSWGVTRAPGGIEITSGGRSIISSTDVGGAVEVHPTRTSQYVLTARNPMGDASASVTVTLDPQVPGIVRFEATPNPGPLNGTTSLSWQTERAERVRIQSGVTEIFDTTTVFAQGRITVTLTETSTTYTLIAQNARGENTVTITVGAEPAPVIAAFTASPLTFVGTSTRVQVAWSTGNATQVALTSNGAAVRSFPGTPNGGFTYTATGSSFLELTARNRVGMVRRGLNVVRLISEGEPNNTPATAVALSGNGSGVSAQINPLGDVDYYRVNVAAGGRIYAATSNGSGGCNVDTILKLYTSNGTTLVISDDEDGPGSCSEIDPARDEVARNLPAGTYYLSVEEVGGDATGAYTLIVAVAAPACGNRYVETRANENCDDGNTSSNDGCSSTCQIEPTGMLNGPGASMTFGGSISPAGQVDIYLINLSARGYILADTYTPSRPSCTGGDTLVRLLDRNLVELAARDEGNGGACGALEATQAMSLPAGRYYVTVEESGNNATIPAYSIELRTIGEACGNGFIESTLNETCDDGNTRSGDGCSSTCRFEGSSEAEPNDDFARANLLNGRSSITAGAINPPGDVDWYRVTVPQGEHLEAYLRVSNTSASCPVVPEARIRVIASDGVTVLASSSFASGNCARVGPDTAPGVRALAGGTYYVVVDEILGGRLPNYFLHVNLLTPACGNGVVEGIEECDDGATQSGDGCSGSCAYEIAQTFNAPGGSAQISLPGAGTYRVVRVNLTIPGQSITVGSSNGPGACTVDTLIRLTDGRFRPLGTKTLDGPGACAAILFPQDSFAQDLAAGAYYVFIVNEGTTSGAVQLEVGIRNPACGNAVTETRAGEQCDDRNVQSNDGCSSACQVEAAGVYAAPGRAQAIPGSIVPIGDRDVFQINVSAPAYLKAETFAPSASAAQCLVVDTFMTLYAANATTALGADGDNGIAQCSRFTPISDSFTRLAPGTYYVAVEEDGSDAIISNYELRLEGIAADVCGNGYAEASVSEQCDDGNLTSGDGCSATCQLERGPQNEVEPNNTIGEANLSGVTVPGTVTMTGAIPILGDVDLYRFTVPAGRRATLIATTYTALGDPTVCNTDTELFLFDNNGNQRAYDDDGGPGTGFGICSQINGTGASPGAASLAPGNYFVKVQAWNNMATIPSYFLDLQLR